MTSFFGDISVRKKLLIGFGLVLLMTLLTTTIGYTALQSTLSRHDIQQVVQKINLNLYQVRQLDTDFHIQGKEESIHEALALIDSTQTIVTDMLQVLTLPSSIERMTSIQADLKTYGKRLARAVEINQDMQTNEREMVEAARGALQNLNNLEAHLNEMAFAKIRSSVGDPSTIRHLEQANLASKLARDILMARRHEKDFIMRKDAKYAAQLIATFDVLDSTAKLLEDQLSDNATRTTIASAREQIARYRAAFDELRQSIQLDDQSESEVLKLAAHIVSASDAAYEEQQALMQDQADVAKAMIAVAGSIGLAVGLLAALFISQLIVGPLQRAVKQALQVAAGDLSTDIESHRKDELGQLMKAMQTMTESLRDLLRRLCMGIDQLAAAAEEVSSATEQSNAGVTQQKLETEQVATAMNQMVATVTEVARNAQSAAASVDQADQHVDQGNLVVHQAIERIESLVQAITQSATAIEHLKHSSNNIGTVLDVIKSIAEQTNLLALNAAIEAARAGEAGRGFAVVADEVRALALRTQESTSQIEQLISTLQDGAEGATDIMITSQTRANHTVEAATQAGEALRAISQSVSCIQQMNQQIAAAAEQQSSVAEEISRSVLNIREVADQSASATQTTATASIELARLGSDLQLAVSRFKLN